MLLWYCPRERRSSVINRTQSRLIAQDRENERRRAQARDQVLDKKNDNTVSFNDSRRQADTDNEVVAAPVRAQHA